MKNKKGLLGLVVLKSNIMMENEYDICLAKLSIIKSEKVLVEINQYR